MCGPTLLSQSNTIRQVLIGKSYFSTELEYYLGLYDYKYTKVRKCKNNAGQIRDEWEQKGG
jgi:hypothetical protein